MFNTLQMSDISIWYLGDSSATHKTYQESLQIAKYRSFYKSPSRWLKVWIMLLS